MARRRRGSRATRRTGERLWTVVKSENDNLLTGVTEGLAIVLGSDWERSVDGLERATLLRIRGSLGFRINAAPNNVTVIAAIVKQDEDEPTVPDLSLSQSYVEEDLLWTQCFVVGGATADAAFHNVEIDVKAKRKLKNSDQVNLCVYVNGATLVYSALCRALVGLR